MKKHISCDTLTKIKLMKSIDSKTKHSVLAKQEQKVKTVCSASSFLEIDMCQMKDPIPMKVCFPVKRVFL